MTTSMLDHLNELEPQSEFDVRRFRMNVIVDTPERGLESSSPSSIQRVAQRRDCP